MWLSQGCILFLVLSAMVLLLTYQYAPTQAEQSPGSSFSNRKIVYGQDQKQSPLLPSWDQLPGKPLWPYESLRARSPPESFQTRSLAVSRALGDSVRDARQTAQRQFTVEIPSNGLLGTPPEGFLWQPSYQGVPIAFSEENFAETYQPAPRLWAKDLNELHERWWRKPRDNLVEPMHARQAWIQLALEGVAMSRKDPYTRLVPLPKELPTRTAGEELRLDSSKDEK